MILINFAYKEHYYVVLTHLRDPDENHFKNDISNWFVQNTPGFFWKVHAQLIPEDLQFYVFTVLLWLLSLVFVAVAYVLLKKLLGSIASITVALSFLAMNSVLCSDSFTLFPTYYSQSEVASFGAFLTICLLCYSKIGWAFASGVLTFVINPLVGIYVLGVLVLSFALTHRERFSRAQIVGGVVAAGLVFASLCLLLLDVTFPSSQEMAAYLKYANGMLYNFRDLSWTEAMWSLCQGLSWMLAALIFAQGLEGGLREKIKIIVAVVALFFVFDIVFNWLITPFHHFIVLLQSVRSVVLLTPFVACYVAQKIQESYKEGGLGHALGWMLSLCLLGPVYGVMLLIVVDVGCRYMPSLKRPGKSWGMRMCAVGFTIVCLNLEDHPITQSAVVFAVAIFVLSLFVNNKKSLPILTVLAFVFVYLPLNHKTFIGNVIHNHKPVYYVANKSNFRKAGEWAEKNTPKHSIFLMMPRTQNGFQHYSKRPVALDQVSGFPCSLRVEDMIEWGRRRELYTSYFGEHTHPEDVALEEVRDLAQKWQAEYAVFAFPPPLELPVLWKDSGVYLVSLKN